VWALPTLRSDRLSPLLQPDLLNFKKGWLTKQYEDGQVSPGEGLPFASAFGATVGPGFWQLTATPTCQLCRGCFQRCRSPDVHAG